MGYDVTITCDLVDCSSRVPVPQQGMIPAGWVAVKEVKRNLNVRAGTGTGQLAEQTSIFCGPRCAIKHFKSYLTGGELGGT